MGAEIASSAFKTYGLVCPQGLPPLSDRSRAASRGLMRVGFEINPKSLKGGRRLGYRCKWE